MKKMTYFLKSIEYKLKFLRTFFINDVYYRKKKHLQEFGETPNFKIPKSLNEKIIHRMIYDKNPLFTQLADKVSVRDYVKDKIGDSYLIPLLGVFDSAEEIDFNMLPERFVIKCNHDSNSSIICTDKIFFNEDEARRKLSFCLSRNMYYNTREWHYKNITPRIICENYIDVFLGKDRAYIPECFRIHCFAGKAHITEADFTDNNKNEYVNVYDKMWMLLPLTMGYENNSHNIPEPLSYKTMIVLAEKLSADIDYCRVDFLLSGEDVYFSEITLTPCNGRMHIKPESWNYLLGELWT
ncbi:ATP-grasp fold amidoligase family protein [Rahnella rivi]|uniref:ATP-grasp fold amidoligase family protein n=2 Tax=Yersiniaceae TaxID=1903411 RepID=UPI0039AEDC9A|nr:glycosyltransferase [Escherichia coli]